MSDEGMHEELWQAFLDLAPAGVAVFGRDMRYLAVSTRWIRDYGLEGREIIGRSHYELFPDLPERWKEIHRRCLAGAIERCEADAFPRANGHEDWVRWEIRPWHRQDATIGGIVIFSELITERVQAEAKLRASEQRFRQVVESAPTAIVVTDAHGMIELVNAQTEKTFGYSRDEMLGQSIELLVPPSYRQGHLDSRRGFSANPRVRGMRGLYGMRKDGREIPVEIGLNPLVFDRGSSVLASILDLSERRQAEAELARSQQR